MAVRAYCMEPSWYQELNENLRSMSYAKQHLVRGGAYPSGTIGFACLLHNAIVLGAETHNVMLYRGVKGLSLASSYIGQKIYFRSFISTSKEKGVAKWFQGHSGSGVMFMIRPGAKGLATHKISDYSYEEEVLFSPFDTFRVVGIEKKGGIQEVTLEHVSNCCHIDEVHEEQSSCVLN
jgi:hypothetical protein